MANRQQQDQHRLSQVYAVRPRFQRRSPESSVGDSGGDERRIGAAMSFSFESDKAVVRTHLSDEDTLAGCSRTGRACVLAAQRAGRMRSR
jgi:hypothetical protein